MAYADNRCATHKAPAIVGVAAIHALLGLGIVTGLAGGVIELAQQEELIGIFQPREIIVPPPPPPEAQQPQSSTVPREVVVPKPRIKLETSKAPVIESVSEVPTLTTSGPSLTTGPATGPTLGGGLGAALPELPVAFDPVPPRPRNNGWVTDHDYRSSWVNRGWEGTAAFRLAVGKDGRVTGCTITQSTGYEALDEATCRLVSRRARFDPAKDDKGQLTGGQFSSAVRWQIPED